MKNAKLLMAAAFTVAVIAVAMRKKKPATTTASAEEENPALTPTGGGGGGGGGPVSYITPIAPAIAVPPAITNNVTVSTPAGNTGAGQAGQNLVKTGGGAVPNPTGSNVDPGGLGGLGKVTTGPTGGAVVVPTTTPTGVSTKGGAAAAATKTTANTGGIVNPGNLGAVKQKGTGIGFDGSLTNELGLILLTNGFASYRDNFSRGASKL